MITNLNVVDPGILPGRAPDVVKLEVNNYRYHQCLVSLSSTMLWLTESSSNNMKAEVTPEDVRTIIAAWLFFKLQWQFALDNNDPPGTIYEVGATVYIPSPQEIQRIPNAKIKALAYELDRLWRVMMGTDSANSGGNVGIQSQSKIVRQIQIVENVLGQLFGSGADNANVGAEAPYYREVGTFVPDVDGDAAVVREPSPDAPNMGFPDVPDTLIQK